MPYLSTAVKKCLSIIALAASFVATADAIEVAFGVTQKDNTLSNIMYYRNGSWERVFPVDDLGFPMPHRLIVGAWVEARHNGLEVDCDRACVGKGNDDAIHCQYTCKLPRPLKQVSAEKLIAFLATVKPEQGALSAEEITKLFSPDILARMLEWQKARERGDMDLQTYAKIFWNSNASAFRRWYQINPPNTAPARFKRAFIGGSMGDCQAEGAVIELDALDEKSSKDQAEPGGLISEPTSTGSGWLATQRSGFTWAEFETIADVEPQLAALAAQVKSRWSELEGRVVEKMRVAASHRDGLKKSIRIEPWTQFRMSRAAWSSKQTTLLYFRAMKYFHSPVLKDGNDDSQAAAYRGWAVLDADGRTGWPSASVHIEPGNFSPEPSYTEVSPKALIELDGRQFLVADSHVRFANGGIPGSEVLELVEGKFRSRGTYPGWCE